jgi:hypothetical protein
MCGWENFEATATRCISFDANERSPSTRFARSGRHLKAKARDARFCFWMAEEEGFEPPCTFRHNRFSKPLSQTSVGAQDSGSDGDAQSGLSSGLSFDISDPDLCLLVNRWPSLPPNLKQVILLLVDSQ